MTFSNYSTLPTQTTPLTQPEPKFSKSKVLGATALAFVLGIACAAATTSASSVANVQATLASRPLVAEPPIAPAPPANDTIIPGCGCSLATCCKPEETNGTDPYYHAGCVFLANLDVGEKDKMCAEVAAGTRDGTESVCAQKEVQQAPPMLVTQIEFGKTCAAIEQGECSVRNDGFTDIPDSGGETAAISFYKSMQDLYESPDWYSGSMGCWGRGFESDSYNLMFNIMGPCMTNPVADVNILASPPWVEGDYLGLHVSGVPNDGSDYGCDDIDPDMMAEDPGLLTYFGRDTVTGTDAGFDGGVMSKCVEWTSPPNTGMKWNNSAVSMRIIYTYTGFPWICDAKAEGTGKGNKGKSSMAKHVTHKKTP